MILTQSELRELYLAVIKPFGHPDPLGYLARAIISSGGDTSYIEGDLIGFMPVNPAVAFDKVGSEDVSTQEGNLTTTLAMDRLSFNTHRNISDMIIEFHFDDFQQGQYTSEHTDFLDAIGEARSEIDTIINPPLATVSDVISVISKQVEQSKVSPEQKKFFEFLLKRA